MESMVLASFPAMALGWSPVADLGIAFVLSAAIGMERERRQRDAGLRTQALVGVAAALFTLVSKYGFNDVIAPDVRLDPSRIAAQIVSGIGFIGGGLIFVRQDAVRGLTTAAAVWLTAAVGMAAGAGMPVLAVLVTAGHFLIVYGLRPLARWLPGSKYAVRRLRVDYVSGRDVLRTVLARCTERGFTVTDLRSVSHTQRPAPQEEADAAGRVSVILAVQGRGSLTDLAAEFDDIPGVLGVNTVDSDDGD
ncbi:MAG: MgtC/SapB family protein [Streptosporangiales bacterium]